MALFENFPYTNLHQLNLDWILQKVKEAYSPDNPPTNFVLSVNGETGDVQLYTDPVVRFPDIPDNVWNIHRMADNNSSGIQFTPTKAQRIDGNNRYDIYDSNNPPPYPVSSVNGQTGQVQLYEDPVVRFPDTQDGTWNMNRVANGSASGIQFTPTKAQRIAGANRYDMYDSNNPPPYPVTSVNGQTGAVNIVIPVQSVNGQTGAVVIPADFRNGDEIMEFTQESEGNYWGLSRAVSTGNASIYLDTSNNTIKAYIAFESTDGQTNVTLPLLTSADIPSSSGVISINSMTGVVTLYGSNIYTDPNSQTTIAQDLAAHGNSIASLQQTQSEDHTNLIQARQNITSLQGRMTDAEATEQEIMESMAILVNGNTSAAGAAAGSYVYVKDSTITGITDGLYKAALAIPANTAIDATYLSAITGGGLNSLNDKLPTLLWTNSSPTTPRGEGTLATGIDFKGFTVFAVKIRIHVSAERYVSCIVPLASETEMIFATDSTTTNRNVSFRYITINNGNIYITGATGGDGTAYQDRLIPVEVYGIW